MDLNKGRQSCLDHTPTHFRRSFNQESEVGAIKIKDNKVSKIIKQVDLPEATWSLNPCVFTLCRSLHSYSE